MRNYIETPFVFSPRYRLLRHLAFWTVHILVFSFLYKLPEQSWWIMHMASAIAAVAFIIYSYPVMYLFIPKFLVKGKLMEFIIILVVWGVAGYFLNYLYRRYVFTFTNLLIEKMGRPPVFPNDNLWAPSGFIIMNMMAGYGSMIVLFKYWVKKQKEYLSAEKEKVNAELQLLKAQVHPHFLFNTLNNIYSFSLENSNKTSQMILKLSSLLSYMLYDCKSAEVSLEKEIEIMKNYIDLEKERYGNRLDISINVEGDMKDKYIAPLLLLPFLENAFKHGTSEQLEKAWLSMEIYTNRNLFRCKIVNSKNENQLRSKNGIGIENVKKRLAFIYPDSHELKLNDEGNFFVVSLLIELEPGPINKEYNYVSEVRTN